MRYFIPHSQVDVSINNITGSAVCDRCVQRWNADKLQYQHDYAGFGVVNKRIKVCPRCVDDLNEQNRHLYIVDNYGVIDGSPPNDITIDGASDLTLQAFYDHDIFEVKSALYCELTKE